MPKAHHRSITSLQSAAPQSRYTSLGDGVVVDLVCQGAVHGRANTWHVVWNGDTFFFCSLFCQRRFSAKPHAFLPFAHEVGDRRTQSRGNHATA